MSGVSDINCKALAMYSLGSTAKVMAQEVIQSTKHEAKFTLCSIS